MQTKGWATSRVLALVLISAAVCFAQTVKKKSAPRPTPASGVISGRIFLITKSGDLKPARLVVVHLFWNHRCCPAVAENEKTVGFKYLQERSAAAERSLAEQRKAMADELRTGIFRDDEKRQCLGDLVNYARALKNTSDWATEQKRDDQHLSTETDEEGNFSVKVPRLGSWTVAALGRAGFNESYWQNTLVLVLMSAIIRKRSFLSAVRHHPRRRRESSVRSSANSQFS